MSLRTLLARLATEAELSGERSAQLHGGAELRYRVRGSRRQLIISRTCAPVGVTELATFLAHGGVPPDATAWCALPVAGRWRVVVEWEAQAQGRLL